LGDFGFFCPGEGLEYLLPRHIVELVSGLVEDPQIAIPQLLSLRPHLAHVVVDRVEVLGMCANVEQDVLKRLVFELFVKLCVLLVSFRRKRCQSRRFRLLPSAHNLE